MKDFGTCGGLFWGTNPSGKTFMATPNMFDPRTYFVKTAAKAKAKAKAEAQPPQD